MTRVVHLAAADWVQGPEGHEARLAVADATRVAVWAQGFAAEGARVECGDAAPVAFQLLGDTTFAAARLDGLGAAIRLVAPAPPSRCVVMLRPAGGHSPTLAPYWPRAVARPVARPAHDLGAARARMDAALDAHDLDGALAPLAEMLLASGGDGTCEDPATREAVAALLAHLVRHPLCRGPALGAFVAALAG